MSWASWAHFTQGIDDLGVNSAKSWL
jgi:hypothetical protein